MRNFENRWLRTDAGERLEVNYGAPLVDADDKYTGEWLFAYVKPDSYSPSGYTHPEWHIIMTRLGEVKYVPMCYVRADVASMQMERGTTLDGALERDDPLQTRPKKSRY